MSLSSAGPSLNDSPSEKEGKFLWCRGVRFRRLGLNESPSEKEGKCDRVHGIMQGVLPQ